MAKLPIENNNNDFLEHKKRQFERIYGFKKIKLISRVEFAYSRFSSFSWLKVSIIRILELKIFTFSKFFEIPGPKYWKNSWIKASKLTLLEILLSLGKLFEYWSKNFQFTIWNCERRSQNTFNAKNIWNFAFSRIIISQFKRLVE